MYESMTYDYILGEMLGKISNGLDKREGSIIYDALAPAAAELAQMYIKLEGFLQETFADTASRDFLILRAKERGIAPKEATFAVAKGVFNIPVPIGSRFGRDGINYKVLQVMEEETHSYKMECETLGTKPNHILGEITPLVYIQGVTSASITEILILGEDEEDTEVFRKRYLSSFNNGAFGGNREDYIKKVAQIQGVGGCKVVRAWNGGGTVKLIIVSSASTKPTAELVAMVQTAIDPAVNAGQGYGVAPINHVVTVVGADEKAINLSFTITYASDWNFEECKIRIGQMVGDYINELNATWQNVDAIIVRASQLEARLLNLEGIVDVEATTINGSKGNYVLPLNAIGVRGSIVG